MIEVENVIKSYGGHKALKGVSLTIDKGEIVGLLGPNGAGKSTMMNIITGYISATEGSVRIDNIDILENPEGAKKNIGYLPEIPPVYLDMTVEEYLYFVSNIKKVPKDKKKVHIEKIMNDIRITNVRSRLIKNLSKGYRQRVGLAQAVVGDPELLILDEPTVGLDPKQIIEIRDVIKRLGKEHTIILSSHILSEVSAVCNRVIIINKGQIVASGTPDELSKKLSYSNKINMRIKGSQPEVLKILNAVTDVKKVNIKGVRESGTVDIQIEAVKDADIRESIFAALCEAKLPILSMESVDLSLEQVFLQVTKEEREDTNVSSI